MSFMADVWESVPILIGLLAVLYGLVATDLVIIVLGSVLLLVYWIAYFYIPKKVKRDRMLGQEEKEKTKGKAFPDCQQHYSS
jgi:membrane protein implicated in regulation of membrane protease activity